MNTYVYYGPERSKDPSVLSRQDVVLTTYSVLASDYGVSKVRDYKERVAAFLLESETGLQLDF